MRRIHLLAFLFAGFVAVPLFAVDRSNNIIDDVIRMQKAGVAEETILDFIHKGDSRFDVSADDVLALHDAGLSRAVIKAVLDEADRRGERRDDGYRGGRTVIVSPRVYGGWPYSYDPFYYDPWWYGPRFSLGFGFGFGGFYGGHYGGFYGGGHHFRHRGRH